VLDAAVVVHGVGGDDDGDGEPEADTASRGRAAKAADEQHPSADEADPDHLHGGARGAEDDDADEEDENGRRATRERVDDRQLRSVVGGSEEAEVDEMEEAAPDHVGPDARVRPPHEGGDRRVRDEGDDEHDRRRRLGVVRPGEEHVPERMEESRRKDEEERRERHRATILHHVPRGSGRPPPDPKEDP